MAKIKIERKDLEKMLKEQFDFKSIKWDKEGNATIDVDLDDLKEKTKIIREDHHHYHDQYRYWPVYWGDLPARRKGWTITCNNQAKFQTK